MGSTKRLGMILLKGAEGPMTVKGAQYGSAVMQPWEKTLNDQKIADVLTYIRQEWGNTAARSRRKASPRCARKSPDMPARIASRI